MFEGAGDDGDIMFGQENGESEETVTGASGEPGRCNEIWLVVCRIVVNPSLLTFLHLIKAGLRGVRCKAVKF